MSAYVDIVLEIFRLPVPQDIGSASFDTFDASVQVMTVGPLILVSLAPRFLTTSPSTFIFLSPSSEKLSA